MVGLKAATKRLSLSLSKADVIRQAEGTNRDRTVCKSGFV